MKKTNVLLFLLTLLLVLPLACACQKAPTKNNSDSTEQPTEEVSMSPPPATMEVEWIDEPFQIIRDANGLRLQEKGLDENHYYEYNENRQLKSFKSVNSAGTLEWAVSEYDEYGRAIKAPLVKNIQTESPYGSTYYFTYDESGNMIQKTLLNDTHGTTISSHTYDANDRLISYCLVDYYSQYTYEDGRVTEIKKYYKQVDPSSHIKIQYGEDGLWKQTEIFLPDENGGWGLFQRNVYDFDAQGGCVKKRYESEESDELTLQQEFFYNANWQCISEIFCENGTPDVKLLYTYMENVNTKIERYEMNTKGKWVLTETFYTDPYGNTVDP